MGNAKAVGKKLYFKTHRNKTDAGRAKKFIVDRTDCSDQEESQQQVPFGKLRAGSPLRRR